MSITYHRKGGEILYKKFEALLEQNNITAYKVAKDTGISTATFSSWKNGLYTPKLEKLKILADYFKVPLEYFCEEKE